MQTTLEKLLEHLAAARNAAEELGEPGLIAATECALVDAHSIIVHEGAIARAS
jgi:hypothetical protein